MVQSKNDQLVALYISECNKLLLLFDKITMDSDARGELIDSAEMFRVLHTLKGSSAMMEYAPLVDLSHRFENILSKIRKGESTPDEKNLKALIDASIAYSSYFHRQLLHIQNNESIEENEALGKQIDALNKDFGNSLNKVATTSYIINPLNNKSVPDNMPRLKVMLRECPLPHIRAFIISKTAKAFSSFLSTEPENIETLTESDSYILKNGFEIQLIPKDGTDINTIAQKISSQPFVKSCSVIENKTSYSENKAAELITNVMLSQSTINELVHYIDELSSEESTLESHLEISGLNTGKTRDLLSSLKHTVKEVGLLASKIGMHSIDNVFMQMQMTVRNMAQELNKSIKVKLSGTDIQVDKSILEILSDCLIHIVRNAADHGIEPKSERKKSGKPETGTVAISASKKNDYLTVTVSDDGRGIRQQDVLDRAEEKGLLKKPRESYSSPEIGNLLFVSGISTNKNVTKYSGRGVGLDTVVRRIKQVGGRITVDSTEGKGTTFTLKIPISLMIIDGIRITVAKGSRMVVPSNAIIHICPLKKSGFAGQAIEYNGISYLPLRFPGEQNNTLNENGFILFLSPDFGNYYLCVNAISMMSSYYVKHLPECVSEKLGRENIYSGCVLCADSQLLCILDAEKLISMSELSSIKEV